MGSSSSPAAIRPASSASTLAVDAAALPSALTPYCATASSHSTPAGLAVRCCSSTTTYSAWLALSILSETYAGKARASAIGIWATVAGLGFGLGPVVGGLLLGVFGWSSIFWVNVPFALAGIALTVTVVPESRNPDTRPVDVPGVLTSAAGLLALIFGLIESASNSWMSAPVAASLAAGLVLLASFVWWEHTGRRSR